MQNTNKIVRILSIDAWRDESGWTWNNWHTMGTLPLSSCDLKPRALFKLLRASGILSDTSKGRVRVDDDQYNIVVCLKGTGQPLIALDYGDAQEATI